MTDQSTPPIRTVRRAPIVLVFVLLSLLAGCGVESESVETIDNAVTLLQDIERNSMWEAVRDGLEALTNQDGYIAAAQLEHSLPESTSPTLANLTLTLAVDAEGDMRYTLEQGGTIAHYIRFADAGTRDDDAATYPGIYRENDGRYTCASEEIRQLLADDVQGLLDVYGLDTISAQTLAVIEEDGERTIIDRDTIHYVIESRQDDALAILEQTDSDDLRSQVEMVEAYTLDGALDLDDATGALLHLDVAYEGASDEQRMALVLDVTQWGSVADIAQPDAANITGCASN